MSNRPRQILEQKWQNVANCKMNTYTVHCLIIVAMLTSLPYSSMLSLPNGDPAPGRSPGPPTDEPSLFNDYDSTTEVPEVTSVVDVDDACAFARIPSDSDNIVTLSDDDSDVNLTVTHPVFETAELVKGVVYDGKSLSDFVSVKSTNLFCRLKINKTFLQRPVSTWNEDAAYSEAKRKVLSLRAVNDTAERAVKLIQDFHGLITAKEEQKQFLLRCVQEHRSLYPDCKKETLKRSYPV